MLNIFALFIVFLISSEVLARAEKVPFTSSIGKKAELLFNRDVYGTKEHPHQIHLSDNCYLFVLKPIKEQQKLIFKKNERVKIKLLRWNNAATYLPSIRTYQSLELAHSLVSSLFCGPMTKGARDDTTSEKELVQILSKNGIKLI